jgi:tetratricopeptide (TPR) repeat protein/transglutaminase-like putative cysteine protease
MAVRLSLFVGLSLLALAGRAAAEDKPIIAPTPDWVKPVKPATTVAGNDGAAVSILLSDQQILFEPGRQTSYFANAIKIQTPQGLAAGNVSLPWRPATDTLKVHSLLIRRGDKVIDVLGSGQTFTVVRREPNLDSATLDGVLTANIQPEGLQVGDVLEISGSITSSDPTLKGHVEQVAGAWNPVPIGVAHLRMQWPSAMPIRLRGTEVLPALKTVKSGAMTIAELTLEQTKPFQPPKGAPARFGVGRLVEASDFKDWSEVSALMAPLFVKAAQIAPASPLATELARIKETASTPKARAEAALALVQQRVRYVALQLGTGNYVPADAETTWSRRFGDCKGKSALLLALLHGLGIEAEPVLVSTVLGDGMDQRLPMVELFDHVIVRATIGGKTYWLDGTRLGDTDLDRIQTPAFGWVLPLQENAARLTRLVPPPLDLPQDDLAIRIDASAGLSLPAPTHIEWLYRGDTAMGVNLALSNLTPELRDRALKDFWKKNFDFIEVKSTGSAFDPKTGEMRVTLDGTANMDWSGDRYETDRTSIGYSADFSRDPGPFRDAPYAVAYPYYSRTVETIILPPDNTDYHAGDSANLNETIAGIAYQRKASLKGNVFTIEKTERSVAPEFAASQATAAQARLRALGDTAIYLTKPQGYVRTRAERDAVLKEAPTTASGFIDRGVLLMDDRRYDEAIESFTRAAAIEPKNAWPLANRGLAYAWNGNAAAAKADLDAAAAIEPKNIVMLHGRAILADNAKDRAGTMDALNQALAVDPKDLFALNARARTYWDTGDFERALPDADAIIALRPDKIETYLLRANLYRRLGKTEDALAQAALVTKAHPDQSYAHVVAARILETYGKQPEAMAELDRAVAIGPEAYIYLNRALSRPKADRAGRAADLDAALKLDPKMAEAIVAKADLAAESGDMAGAIAAYTAALKENPSDSDLLTARGILYAKAAQPALAAKDFAAARAAAKDATALNNMCWRKATAGIGLESALLDCNAALEKVPGSPAYLDSRGLVLLRLGKLDDAIKDYDSALAQSSQMPTSLYGRAIAWSRKGDRARAIKDQELAVKIDPKVEQRFDEFGVKF